MKIRLHVSVAEQTIFDELRRHVKRPGYVYKSKNDRSTEN